jgi:hypothetical protein
MSNSKFPAEMEESMWKVDNKGWILVNNRILNLSLIERIQISDYTNRVITIDFNSGSYQNFEYDTEEKAKKEFELIKKAMGF